MKILNPKGGTSFWQWNTGRKIVILGDEDLCGEAHFCTGAGDPFPVTIRTEDGQRVADVPDEVLQEARPFTVYVWGKDESGNFTRSRQGFQVFPTEKPIGYVYTPTERQTWEQLHQRILKLEEGGGSGNYPRTPEFTEICLGGDNGLKLIPEGTAESPKLTLYGAHGDQPVEICNAATATGDRGVPNLGQVKELLDDLEQTIPTVTVVQTEDGATFTATDKNGTTTATLRNGLDGRPGKDGVSATHIWDGTVLSITSASGTFSADLKGEKGDKGDPGEKGEPGKDGSPGEDGQDGGHYTPVVTQPTASTMQVEFVPSKEGMPAVESVTVELPQGSGGGGTARWVKRAEATVTEEETRRIKFDVDLDGNPLNIDKTHRWVVESGNVNYSANGYVDLQVNRNWNGGTTDSVACRVNVYTGANHLSYSVEPFATGALMIQGLCEAPSTQTQRAAVRMATTGYSYDGENISIISLLCKTGTYFKVGSTFAVWEEVFE